MAMTADGGACGGEQLELDTTDMDRWLGVPLQRLQPRYPTTEADIGRWAQGMQNPNPLYYDPDFAAASRFGGIVAPAVVHGRRGRRPRRDAGGPGPVPGSHMLFGGDEWWFFGPRIRPGDLLQRDTMLFDYKVTETRFAGPTMFSRGDTTYVNQRGELVGKQRSTAIRYLVEEAVRRSSFGETRPSRRGARGTGWRTTNASAPTTGFCMPTGIWRRRSTPWRRASSCPSGSSARIRWPRSRPSTGRARPRCGGRRITPRAHRPVGRRLDQRDGP